MAGGSASAMLMYKMMTDGQMRLTCIVERSGKDGEGWENSGADEGCCCLRTPGLLLKRLRKKDKCRFL